jgi:RNA polymerase sigma-70 factor (ECF subfamily)
MNSILKSNEKKPILKRVVAGDESAFADFIDKYGKLVWSLAKKYTQTTEDAEDAVQEIFMEIWQNAERFDESKASEITFIATIARRRLIDRVRKVYRTPNMSSIDEIFETHKNVFENEIHTQIEAKKVVKAMNVLRPEQRDLMLLTIFEGMSHGEIAEKTGIPLGTVKTHIRRGFARVREIMQENSLNLATT